MEDDPDQILERIGQQFAARRQALGLSQRELADKLGITQANIARIEHGKQNLTVRTMAKMTAALGMRMADLFEAKAKRESKRARSSKG